MKFKIFLLTWFIVFFSFTSVSAEVRFKNKKDKQVIDLINKSNKLKEEKKNEMALLLLKEAREKTENPHILNRINIEFALICLDINKPQQADFFLKQVKVDILPANIKNLYDTLVINTNNALGVGDVNLFCHNELVSNFLNKEYKKAIEIYEVLELDKHQNHYCDLLYGMSLRSIKRYDSSIKALSLLEEKKPQKDILLKVKIEKIIAYFELKDFDLTITSIDDTLSKEKQNLDAQSINGLENIKAMAAEGKKHQDKIIGGSFGVDYAFDTNPNFSNSLTKAYLYALQRVGIEDNDNAFMANFDLHYNYKINRNVSLFGFGGLNYLQYQKVRDRDSLRFNISQGLNFNYDKHGATAMFSYQNMFLGRTSFPGDRYLDIYMANLTYLYKYNDYFTFKINYQIFAKDFLSVKDRNSYTNILNLQTDVNITRQTFLYASFGGGFEKTTTYSYYDNYLLNLYVGCRHFFSKVPVYVNVMYNFTFMDFMAQNVYLDKIKRKDFFHGINTSIHLILFKHLDLHIGYNLSVNKSNVFLYEYTRHFIYTGAKFIF